MKRISVLLLCFLLSALCFCLASCGHEHTWDDGKITTAAECGTATEGVKTYTCTQCGEKKTESFVSSAEKHCYGEWVEVTPATCMENGEKKRTCENCGKVLEGVIETKGDHTWNEGNVSGKNKYFTCTLCGERVTKKATVTYGDFGAKGDGETNDYQAIYDTHVYANEWGLNVTVDEDAVYYISDVEETIPIRTNVDWQDAQFIIDDRGIDYTDYNHRMMWVFAVESDTVPVSVTTPAKMKISKGQTNIGLTFEKACMLRLEDNIDMNKASDAKLAIFKRYGVNEDNGVARQELILVDKDGNVDPSTPIQYDYGENGNSPFITMYDIDETPITLQGGVFTTYVPDPVAQAADRGETFKANYQYYNRGLKVYRANTTLLNIQHYIEDPHWAYMQDKDAYNTGIPYNAFYSFDTTYNILMKNCVVTGHRAYRFYMPNGAMNEMGSYDMEAETVLNMTFDGVIQSNSIIQQSHQHGVFGSNFCRNMVMKNSSIDRFDAHRGLCGAKIIDSTIGFGIYLIGGGDFYIENVTRLTGATFVHLRDDYGSTFDGDLYIINCKYGDADVAGAGGGDFIINATWREFDYGLPAHVFNNITIDGLVCRSKSVSLYNLTQATNSTTTDITKNPTNPLILPETVTLKNMKDINLGSSTSKAVTYFTSSAIKVTKENMIK